MIMFIWDRSDGKEKRSRRIWSIVILCCFLLVLLGVGYVDDFYPADDNAQSYMRGGEGVVVTVTEKGWFFDGPGEAAALVFYPGAKVESASYAPLMYSLAEQGVDCFLLDMPCHLALFGTDYADAVMEEHAYDRWYLGGHSLGGVVAAMYAADHMDRLEGIVLLAAYSTKDLSDGGLKVLSVYGSEDRVLDHAEVAEARQYMPESYTEICMQGGNHAQFGSYGEQDGDGEARISSEEQIKQTVEAIIEFMGER